MLASLCKLLLQLCREGVVRLSFLHAAADTGLEGRRREGFGFGEEECGSTPPLLPLSPPSPQTSN